MHVRKIAFPKLQARYSIWSDISNRIWKQITPETINPTLEDIEKNPVKLIDQAFHDHIPAWYQQENRERQQVQIETAHTSLDEEKFQALLSQATYNLECWSDTKKSSPQQVEVVNEDWGVLAQQVSRKHGKIYGILNMADSNVCGGGFLFGNRGQEENFFGRTTCIRHLVEEKEQIYIDAQNTPRYKMEMRDLINARILMNTEELNKLCLISGKFIEQAYKIHMDTREPEICFKGPEIIFKPKQNAFFDGQSSAAIALSRKDGSFHELKAEEIFLFHEIRSAAIDLTDPDLEMQVDWENQEFLDWFRAETKRRIDAQLYTLILNGIDHVVLSAFGCGAFENRADEVAKIYKESIIERAEHFKHIVFAIYYPGYGRNNVPHFERELQGIMLGENAVAEKTHRMGMRE